MHDQLSDNSQRQLIEDALNGVYRLNPVNNMGWRISVLSNRSLTKQEAIKALGYDIVNSVIKRRKLGMYSSRESKLNVRHTNFIRMQDRIPIHILKEMFRLFDVTKFATEFFEDRSIALRWLNGHHSLLNNKPANLLDNEYGEKKVMEMINAMCNGGVL